MYNFLDGLRYRSHKLVTVTDIVNVMCVIDR